MPLNKEDLIEEIKGMSVLDLAEVVKALEEEFGVSAAAPVAVADTKLFLKCWRGWCRCRRGCRRADGI